MADETYKEDLYLVLGCFGRIDDGFVNCSTCENKILKVVPSIEGYDDMMTYFDTCRMFDKPVFDFNAVKHILSTLQNKFDQVVVNKRLWPEKEVANFQKFILGHRHCGLYMKLITVAYENEEPQPSIPEKSVTIPAHSKQMNQALPRINLKLIRGRRN